MAEKFTSHATGLPAKVRPRGKALARSDSQLDAMTTVEALQARVEDAGDDWRANAPSTYKTLLDSELEESN